ncbi:unnamed protein product [Moneuplotes crassus]|uniref:Uncharacterized protein n=1 Tax=Euplotes crassus TaxID=5936 RepID=A0AAD1U559_EUPCR|nr:unnamed protein product [Moneuplotes crassus]
MKSHCLVRSPAISSDKDQVLLCEFHNDNTLYGGNTTYNIKYEPEKKCIRCYGLHKLQNSGLLKYMTFREQNFTKEYASQQYMFGGFRSKYHAIKRMHLENGLAITLENLKPSKNLVVEMTVTGDQFTKITVGCYILDHKEGLNTYQLPFRNFIDMTTKSIFPCFKDFDILDFAIFAQGTEEGPYDFRIRKVDFIYNKEFENESFIKMSQGRAPVMFGKELPKELREEDHQRSTTPIFDHEDASSRKKRASSIKKRLDDIF